jgi:hypothetical protein
LIPKRYPAIAASILKQDVSLSDGMSVKAIIQESPEINVKPTTFKLNGPNPYFILVIIPNIEITVIKKIIIIAINVLSIRL